MAIFGKDILEEHIFEIAANNRTGIVREFDHRGETKVEMDEKNTKIKDIYVLLIAMGSAFVIMMIDVLFLSKGAYANPLQGMLIIVVGKTILYTVVIWFSPSPYSSRSYWHVKTAATFSGFPMLPEGVNKGRK